MSKYEDGSLTDDQLVELVKNGDSRAFEELVVRHQKAMYYFVLRLVKNPMDAEDTVQKIFLLAFKNIRGFRLESSFKTWLYRIGINQCHNFFRENKRREYTPIEDTVLADTRTDQEENVSDKEMTAYLHKAVERLPNKQKMVVVLRVFQDLSFEEIGRTLQIHPNSAKVNFHYAIKKIKKWVRPE
jgi:RNA polymerase sigma-70 factor (ECF subfamily)